MITNDRNRAISLKNITLNNRQEDYQAPGPLISALEVAYALRRPLLLSGEPGTGKTEFARFAAHQLSKTSGFAADPIEFNTKSSSVAQDLFYHYDAVAHFRTSNMAAADKRRKTEDFIELRALGKAFANAIGSDALRLDSGICRRSDIAPAPTRSVVLIDEIDKAPRDFPNDLLNEIERYEFEIKEINKKIQLSGDERNNVLIIMTSNFEKTLPEAFLRRCIYYHIEFPEPDLLKDIVKVRTGLDDSELGALDVKVKEFFLVRNNTAVQKKPSTAEFIDFIRVVKNDGYIHEPLFHDQQIIKGSRIMAYLPALLKKKEDLQLYTGKL